MTTPDPGPEPDGIRVPDRRMISFDERPGGASAAGVTSSVSAAGDAGVRPFIITGGRTAPADERLRIETQVLARPVEDPGPLAAEQRRIVALCSSPISVAEISAALQLPVGVARVLVADLALAGHLSVHTAADVSSRHVLERILDRVHAL
jgi:Protein of unknown function (DUF742)